MALVFFVSFRHEYDKKLFLLGLLTAAPCVAGVVPDSVPFELGADRRVYVTCQVGTDARRLRFLLDTGATDVVLNTAPAPYGGAGAV